MGETKRRLKDRFNEHRRAFDKTKIKPKPTTVSEHFLSHTNHSHTDMRKFILHVTPFPRVGSRTYGLNRRDELL